MTPTVEDYAAAVPRGPVLEPPHVREFLAVEVEQVEARGAQVVATMRWSSYPHPIRYAVLPDEVSVMGGHVPHEEATLDQWADEVGAPLAWGATLPLLSSRRSRVGDAVEVTEAEPPDPRFTSGHLLGTAPDSAWREVADLSDPAVPPPTIESWRADGTLATWHHVRLQHRHVLPVCGHAAARWVGDATASLDHLEIEDGMPETFALLTVAEVMHSAAGAGARTIVCTVDVPGAELLGFRERDGLLRVDTRFLDVDHDGVARLVRQTSGWTPSADVQAAIGRTDRATYYAG
ncbi:hypothetical protein [Aeromicrobium sp. Root472D3]|uniref:hypothetical protein n=1 Tax=Aeromicrobium sp. Root472D3 TaxID=1736540 RepID=UPI000AE3CF5C|nr:hypothetical protein [Aeromicrobium sp. Root472D3]